MNPYLTEDNQPSQTLQYTLDYCGISLEEFKAMTDGQVIGMVKRFSDVLNDGRDSKGSHNQDVFVEKHGGIFGEIGVYGGQGYGDSGSFSRYFDLDKWFSEKLKQLPASVQKTFPFLIVSKASKSEKNKGCEGLESKTMGQSAKNRVWSDKCANCGLKFIGGEPRCHCENKLTSKEKGYQYKNNHPTVKPLKLLSYLITLGSREGDIILDPFVGSGTATLASGQLNRKCIGIEISEEYCEISANRCGADTVARIQRGEY